MKREIRSSASFFQAMISMFLLLTACSPPEAPPAYRMIVLEGNSYERGYAHGERFSSEIRSLYTQLLTSSLLPSLNRERPDISQVLVHYQDEEYADGRFGYAIVLENAYALEYSIPDKYIDEMRGIADGARLPYDTVLMLNTFVDSVLGIRSLQRYLGQWNAPFISSVSIIAEEGDNSDNEYLYEQKPFELLTHAHFTNVPRGASIRIVLEDNPGVRASNDGRESDDEADGINGISGVDPASIRIRLDDTLYTVEDDDLIIRPLDSNGIRMEVILRPSEGLPKASVVAIGIEAANLEEIEDPPPVRSRVMRQQWFVIGTEGYAASAEEIPNFGGEDHRFPPPPVAFAAEGGATADGSRLLAHHFSLLDAGTLHRHVAVFAHKPEGGIPHVVVGWTGLIGGFSGMNEEGLVWTVNHSDSLNNPVVQSVRTKLEILSSGLPITMLGREVLERAADVDEAGGILANTQTTVGWNHLLAGEGGLRIFEADGNIESDKNRQDYLYGPSSGNEAGIPSASLTDEDLRISAMFLKNRNDIDGRLLVYDLPPQRFWSPYWNRALRAFLFMETFMSDNIGRLDAEIMIDILRREELVDPRDSMNAVVYEPDSLRLRLGAGVVPATDAEFDIIYFDDIMRGE